MDKKPDEPDSLDVYQIIEKIEDKAKDKLDAEKIKEENKLLKEMLQEIKTKYESLQEKNVGTHVDVNKHKKEIQRLLDHVNVLMKEKEDYQNQVKTVLGEKQFLLDYIKKRSAGSQIQEQLIRFSEDKESSSTLSATYKMKLVMIGDYSVGKTSFIKRFAKEQFSEDYKPTIGAAITKLRCGFKQDIFDLIMWDLTGQVAFEHLASKYMEDADLAILMYDITRMETFQSVKKWYQKMLEVLQGKIPCLLIGNKIDLENQRKVSFESGLRMSDDIELNFLEASVKEDKNIEIAIINLINQYLNIK